VTRLWCELAWLGGERAEQGVLIEVEGERIASVARGVEAPEGAERLRGLTVPGLANAHSHAFQRALRGRTQVGTGSFWTWREQMYELAGRLDPDSMFALAQACFGEMLLAGITCVGEFHYVHGPDDMEAAVIAAAREAGIRMTLLDACYLHGGIDAFRDADVHAWGERVSALSDAPDLRIGAAIHSVRAVDPDSARVVAEWADLRPLHAHVSEQPRENEECVARHGRTPTQVLADAGALSGNFTAIHATHLTPEDVALLADVTVCLCPTTERDLADGIGPARKLRDAGSTLAVGSDSQAVIDPFEEMRAIELDERLATGTRGLHPAAELLSAATLEGYAALGWPEGGWMEGGALADLTTISLDGVRLAGTRADHAVESVVFAAGADDVTDVFVGGRRIVRGGAHVSLDVPAELARVV
jgi:formiminoglutamate deiminase